MLSVSALGDRFCLSPQRPEKMQIHVLLVDLQRVAARVPPDAYVVCCCEPQ
jgi:hypothetical protein